MGKSQSQRTEASPTQAPPATSAPAVAQSRGNAFAADQLDGQHGAEQNTGPAGTSAVASAMGSGLALGAAVASRSGRSTATGGAGTREVSRTTLQQSLAGSSTGAAALAYIDAHRVPLSFRAGKSANANCDFDKGTVEVLVGTDQTVEEAGLYLVHEAHHVREFIEGNTAQPEDPDQEAYVDHMCLEESTGTAKSIRAKLEVEAASGKRSSAPQMAGEADYRWAYKVEREGGANEDVAHEHATDHLYLQFRFLSHAIGPNAFETYPEYYRREWKKVHGSKKKAAVVEVTTTEPDVAG